MFENLFNKKNTSAFSKWSWLYFVLASLDLIAIGTSLGLNHHISTRYENVVELNELWTNHLNQLAKLRSIASEVNAPGNDIFESSDPDHELARMEDAIARFHLHYQTILADFKSPQSRDQIGETLALFEPIKFRMNEMEKESRSIFRNFKAQKRALADSKMAVMDRKYENLQKSIADCAHEIRATQENYLKKKHQEVASLWNLELFFAFFILLIIVGILFYGNALSKFVLNSLKSQEQLQEVSSALDETSIVAVTDAAGKIIYVNQKFVEISGYEKEELIGNNHRILKSGYHSKEFYKKMWSTISSGKIWTGEICNRSKNGNYYWVDTTIIPTMDKNGKIHHFTAIRREITAKKAIEEKNAALNEMQKAILFGASYAIISTDRDGIIKVFNPAAERMLGYKAEEIINKKTPSIFHEESEVIARAQTLSQELGYNISPGFNVFVAKARLGHTDENEWTYIRRDKTKFPVYLSVTALRGPNRDIYGFVGIASDITESKKIKDELIASRETAIMATQAKARFLANMSHEIRTPMNGIIGMSNLLLESVSEPDQVNKIKIIQNCGNSLLELINDVLDFSKLEVDKVELEQEPFSLYDVVKEIVELLNTRASEKGIVLAYHFNNEVPPWIVGDVTRFRQILTNLVSNAIKFTEFGRVDIFSSATSMGKKLWRIQFSVKDTGIGIPDKVKQKLFQSFSQVDASTTRRFGGSGLGLAISKGLCEKMGGSIWLESTPGKGSTFSFNITAKEGSPQESDQSNSTEKINLQMAKEHPLKILIAEDNRTNQIVAVGFLGKLGYKADTAENGIEVLAKIEKVAYDLILMDCHMPELDGFETTRIIINKYEKNIRPTIIALSASTMKEDIDRCYAAGMDAFLGKPINLPMLAKLIKDCKPKNKRKAS